MKALSVLELLLASMGPIAVAVSGGVDNMTLAVLAHRNNSEAEIFHAISLAVPEQTTSRVREYAELEKW